jgi:hypothetical protein
MHNLLSVKVLDKDVTATLTYLPLFMCPKRICEQRAVCKESTTGSLLVLTLQIALSLHSYTLPKAYPRTYAQNPIDIVRLMHKLMHQLQHKPYDQRGCRAMRVIPGKN